MQGTDYTGLERLKSGWLGCVEGDARQILVTKNYRRSSIISLLGVDVTFSHYLHGVDCTPKA